jgi:HlyD family secretion protein
VTSAAAQLRQAQARRTAAQAAAEGGDLAAAQAGVASAQARLEQVKAGGRPEDLAAAQTAIDTAQARLDQLNQGTPRVEDVRAAELEVDRARAALDQAVAARDEAAARGQGQAASRPELDRLDAGVKSAQIGVELAQNALARASAGANAWEIRQAQLAVDQARASFEKLKSPTPYDVEQAQAAVDQARASVDKLLQAVQTELDSSQAAVEMAQAALDKLQAPSPFDVQTAREGVRQAEAQLEKVRNGAGSEVAAARAAFEQARANLDRIAATRPFELDAAQRAVDQARAQLALKQAGASEADLENARARITQAETGLAQARLGLDHLALVAPFAGVVTQVSVREGEQATPATTAITLGNLDAFYVETRDLDEIGAAKVRVAQPARITVNALEKTLPGKVAAIDLQATTTQTGDTNFTVKLTFDQPEPGLRWGQTVKVEFGR